LVARFSREEFGFISIHDPTTGEWHDIPTKGAPAWAKAEAFKRKDLYRSGERRLLTQAELEEIWAKGRIEDEGIVDGVGAAMDSKGLVFEDYQREE